MTAFFNHKPSWAQETKKKDYQTLTGTITMIQQGDLGCYIDIKSGSVVHNFIADFNHCYSKTITKGKIVKVDWKNQKIDDCDGGFGCGKYTDTKMILSLETIKY